MSLVSVIMPVYNEQEFVAESIDSILNQTFQDFELIIVNDGSTDNTENILNPYLGNKKIRYYKFQKNKGYAEACNKAVALAQGSFIAVQDGDDISLPSRLKEEVKVLESNPEIELVYSQVFNIDREGKVSVRWGGKGRKLSMQEAFYELYLNGNFVPNPTVMMRRRHINGMFYDSSLLVCNDFEHLLRLTHDHQIFEINYPLVKLRRGKRHSSMTTCRELNFGAERQILKMIHRRYQHSCPMVSKCHYRKAMSNQLYKESQFYRSAEQVWKSYSLIMQAMIYNPINPGIYKSLLRKALQKVAVKRSRENNK